MFVVEARLSKTERDTLLISAILKSTNLEKPNKSEHGSRKDEKVPASKQELEEAQILDQLTEDQLFKECLSVLKEYFNVQFLNTLKQSKVVLFRLYKLYLLNELSKSMMEENKQVGKNHKVNYESDSSDDLE